jgi:hypothetical protein
MCTLASGRCIGTRTAYVGKHDHTCAYNGFLQLATRYDTSHYVGLLVPLQRISTVILEWNTVPMTCITLSYNMCSLFIVHTSSNLHHGQPCY